MKSTGDKTGPVIDFRPKRRADLNFRNIEGETIILDRQSGLVHQLNPTASLIWSYCDGESTMENIAGYLVAAYEVELSTAIKDVTKVVGEFQNQRLLVAQVPERESIGSLNDLRL